MSLTAKQLYELLPAIYRVRDTETGEPLKALVAVIAEQAAVMEADIARLYENWFIETCDEWVVPYIGDLLGVRGLHSLGSGAPFSQRGLVANTLSYRRRKGTATMLEQLAHDTTGWNARAVEFFELLQTTQHYNHIRRNNVRTPDLRRTNELEMVDTAFDTSAHTADVRRIAIGRGRHNIPNVGLFIWRLQSYFVARAQARAVALPVNGLYTFSPLGQDAPLFNRPQTETEIAHLAEEINVPGLLRRRPLYDELETRRQATADELGEAALAGQPSLYAALAKFRHAVIDEGVGLPPFMISLQQANASQALLDQLNKLLNAVPLPRADIAEALREAMIAGYHGAKTYFGAQPVLQLFVQLKADAPFYEALPEEIQICNLSEPPKPAPEVWLRPPASRQYQPKVNAPKQSLSITAAVDPVLGRVAFPTNVNPNAVNVSYAYGFSGDVGGGPYDRRESVEAARGSKVTWQVGVSKEVAPSPGAIFATIAEAVAEWNLQPAGTAGVIAIMDSETYAENLTGVNRINIPEGSRLLIVAADWPEVPKTDGAPGQKQRIAGDLAPDDRRPHVLGEIVVRGTAPAGSPTPGELVLDGLLLEGRLRVRGAEAGNLGSLDVNHCTLVPGKSKLLVKTRNEHLKITLMRSICGPIVLTNSTPSLRLNESIVDGAGGDAIAAAGTAVEVEKSTVLGSTSALRIEAGNSIFTGAVKVIRQQVGCIRFSYLPDESKTPRRFRCQPDLALKNVEPAKKNTVIVRLAPSFTSEDYGDYGYGQLRLGCAEELRTGAEDGSEMGVFSFLRQPQRVTNLQTGLDEYLRFGLEAGIIFVT